MGIAGLGEVAERLRKSTVVVRPGGSKGNGSGVIWSTDGLILTNAHVACGKHAEVCLSDGREGQAEVTARDARCDLAALRISAPNLFAVGAADSSRVRAGELVIAVGNPMGFVDAVTTGVVHGVGPIQGLGRHSWVQSDLRLAPGNSGGPLADVRGRVIAVFLIAASPRARHKLELRLAQDEVEILGAAADLEMAAEELAENDADVVLISVGRDSHEDLLGALEETRLARELPVVLMVDQPLPQYLQRAMLAGVKGILATEVEVNSLQNALKAVASGLIVLSPKEVGALRSVIDAFTETAEAIESLTPREKEVLQKMASGLGNKEIAAQMKISEHTAKFHVASILSKLGAGSRTEAVSTAMRRGLILL